MKKHPLYLFSLMIALSAALLLTENITPAPAGGVVGNGTPASCTEASR